MKKWKVLKRDVAFECKWLKLYKDKCINERGSVIPEYYWYEGKNYVRIIGITKDQKLVMVQQYRHGSKQIMFEFPAGQIDKDEQPVETATRELIEETGYVADDVVLERDYFLHPSLSNKKGHIVLARNLQKEYEQNLEDCETINIKLVDFDELEELIISKKINDADNIMAAMIAMRNKDWLLK